MAKFSVSSSYKKYIISIVLFIITSKIIYPQETNYIPLEKLVIFRCPEVFIKSSGGYTIHVTPRAYPLAKLKVDLIALLTDSLKDEDVGKVDVKREQEIRKLCHKIESYVDLGPPIPAVW